MAATADGGAELDLKVFQTYLTDVVPNAIGGSVGELVDALEHVPEAVAGFIGGGADDASAAGSIFVVVRNLQEEKQADAEAEEGAEDAATAPPFEIKTAVEFASTRQAIVTFIKRTPGPLQAPTEAMSLQQQLLIMTYGEGSPFETLHSYVRHAVGPYLNSAVNLQRAGDIVGKTNISRAVAELELQLTHLQQNVDIPEITLKPHPKVKDVVTLAATEKRKPTVADFGDLVENADFLNALQKGVSKWVKEMQKVTKMERDPSSGSAIQEVNFWLNLEDALRKMKEKRESIEIELTMDVLKQGKRFHATVSFDSDTGLAKKLEMVMDYNPLMKDFPKCIDTLLKAQDTDELRTAVIDVFSHLKKIRNTKYPVARALKLVSAISRDLNERLLKMLGNQRLMQARDEDFDRIISGCKRVFNTWDDEDEMYRNILRELIKRHSRRDDGVKTFRRVKPQHETLKKRLEELGNFRKQHDQLRNVIGRVLRPTSQEEAAGVQDADDANAIEEVNLAYKDVEMVDALDLTEVGVRAWQAVQKRYSERIETVEIRIIAKLNDQLSKAKNANEMFRIFKKFNALFVRPKIKGAIREYQTQLIERVKADIDQLHTKFKVQFAKTMNARMSEVRDLPPVSSLIIWVKQIDRQLTEYMNRVEDVLGKDWGGHREGRALKQNEAGFRKDLGSLENQAFTEWKENVEKRQIGVTGRIFNIDMQRRSTGNSWELSVNFHEQIVTLSKEVRNLKWLKYRVPLVIVNKALQANHLYPFAISLKASIRTYRQTLDKLSQNEEAQPLVASYHKTIQNCVSEGVTLRWESYRLEPYVASLADAVFTFQDKVDDLLTYNKHLSELIASLETCKLDQSAFAEILAEIQKVVDDLNLKAYVNLDAWTERLDKKVEEKLVGRLGKALQLWLVALDAYGEKSHDWDARDTGLVDEDVKEKDLPTIEAMEHTINFRNQVMILNPPAENARENLFSQLQAHLAIICDLSRIKSSKFIRASDGADLDKSKTTYRTLLTRLPEGGGELVKAYEMIDGRLRGVHDYVKIWLQYQALWDIQSDTLVDRLGDDLDKWQQLLVEIKKARKTFDTTETTKEFGPVVINFAQVQTKVNLKYDSLHSDVLKRFGTKMHAGMEDFYTTINKARSDLEAASIDSASTSESVAIITTIQGLKRKVGKWTNSMNLFKLGERLLERQRFTFPEDWRYVDYIEGEWNAFTDILSRKDSQLQGQLPQLQMKVTDEDRILSKRVNDLLGDWGKNKPVGNNVDPNEAINNLVIFEGRFTTIKEEYDTLVEARLALDLDVRPDDRIDTSLEELRDLKSSWGELGKIFTAITKLKEIAWAAVVPRKVKKALEDILGELRNLPARVRSYASYEATLTQVQDFKEANKVITDLKSEALKDRHWKVLLKKLGLGGTLLTDLTLGNLFDLDLVNKKSAIDAVMLEAQGEMALEKFLQQTEEEWDSAELELVNYQNKTKLIKGWQELFDMAKDRLASLGQMKLSPYYAAFKEKTEAWDTKLNNVMLIFEIWMGVQEKWVYLEGIFLGSADIRTLLPSESSRFQSISTEFLSLSKKVSQNPVIIDVIALPNVAQTLERLEQLLVQIKKALADYLERQRALFPRFYFVGDNDLLEIIGNAKDVTKLQRHFRKLFSGVHEIILTEDGESTIGCSSMEGEKVMYTTPVKIAGEKINVWLTNMDKEISVSLASLLADSTGALIKLDTNVVENGAGAFDCDAYLGWVDQFQAQIVVLSTQVSWSERTDDALNSDDPTTALTGVFEACKTTLDNLADTVLLHQPPVRRTKLEHLITEIVHQRDVTADMIKNEIKSAKHFDWLAQMRFYFNPKEADVMKQLSIKIANAYFSYGFEYLGLGEKLVQTPLTDVAFTTLTQGLKARQGGAPFGPAGTGKTESVKMLGRQLGRWCLVFNCDETFDSEAMQRILMGLCQVGAFGCFDEFNRLEEAQLSAVSQQIQAIQEALVRVEHEPNVTVEVVPGNPVPLNGDVGVFITMNPGYAGRSELPDNLKKLFRQLAMTKPDGELIAQVMLFSQGFRNALELSRKVVPLFQLCNEQLSKQAHYDFGLRALKAVLISAGNIKRQTIARFRQEMVDAGEEINEASMAAKIDESDMLIKSVSQTMLPKLVGADDVLLRSLLNDVFPNAVCDLSPVPGLQEKIEEVCAEQHYVADEKFIEKILQLYQVTEIAHGLMMVGPSGAGKSAAWNVLLEALRRFEGTEAHSYIIDPKAINKDELYGFMDPTTREWTDGVFTSIVRRVIDNKLGELNKRQWIVFDGDVDPEWVENLNSVLDDNKLLTLPNGERLALPKCLRVIFEVQDLKNATLATVSRCGMIWFSEDVLDTQMQFDRFINLYRTEVLDKANADLSLSVQNQVADILEPHFTKGGLVESSLEIAEGLDHIMVYSHTRAMNSLFCVLKTISRNIITYNENVPDFPLAADQIEKYTSRQLINFLMWSLVGDAKNAVRKELSDYLSKASTIPLPEMTADGLLIDYHCSLEGNRPCEWVAWEDDVPVIEIQAEKIAGTDVVIPTVDTERHVDMLYTWLADHLPVVLCGPPGSGKTMTLVKALRRSSDFIEALVNFSSSTTPQVLLDTFAQYCEYRKTPNGLVLEPRAANKWLVVFCDEVNLPAADAYNTVRVITFMRQLVERGGFWRAETLEWVTIKRIQFVGACNPPTDPGRVPLAMRFLRHVPVIYVDYPSASSYKQIYGTFCRALMKVHPEHAKYAEPLTDAMVDFFMQTQEHFTADMQPFYIYSPREMTRWIKGIKECIWSLDSMTPEDLVRIWAHEALRLFCDRLVYPEEREWTNQKIDDCAKKYFPSVDCTAALQRPILFSNWMSKNYVPVELEPLREFVQARMKVFHEEALDVPLVLFDDVLDHVLRIDRIFKQNQGHCLLIGVAGGGKTTLSRFVAWMNGLTVFQVKVHNQYTAEDFDGDLRTVLRRSGCDGEKIAFIVDEGNIMDTAFLERMNTLLANGEVPGLFEGDEYASLMTQCKSASMREGEALDGEGELYEWFSKQILKNLHVVFTMNPSQEDGAMQDRASTSPALFNRCVLDWYGDWSDQACYQVSTEFTLKLDLEKPEYSAPATLPICLEGLNPSCTHREAVNNAFLHVHQSAKAASMEMRKREGRSTHITPRHLLETVNQFVGIYKEKCSKLEEEKRHLGVGLRKLETTFEQVAVMKKELAVKRNELERKDVEAAKAMERIVEESTIANDAKKQAVSLSGQLEVALVAADNRKDEVTDKLAHVEPAVEAAKKAVGKVNKKALEFIKALANPPKSVKDVCEAVCVLLGEGARAKDWKQVRAIMLDGGFITRVLSHNSEDVTEKIKKQLKIYTEGGTNEELIAKATRASTATGALMTWVLAKLEQIEVLLQIEPLRNELADLNEKAVTLQATSDENTAKLAVLETNIVQMKREFGETESAKQVIKMDLERTETKVGRAQELLDSLSGEKERWTAQDADFALSMRDIIGDSLLASAYLAYAGYFNQSYRGAFMQSWKNHLKQSSIEFSSGLSIPEYLSTPESQLQWEKNGLPTDELCSENAVMIERGLRYPLVIDPAGQAKSFLQQQYKSQKVIETSFANPGFRKSLESAIRFGTPLIVRDAEKYDPIMNPVLNREYHRTGGRLLITIGDQEIDMSPSVTIVLTASEPAYEFPPDLCSRVSMANFTVTRGSLQSQCLSRVLKAERPDVEAKRTDLLKQNGEFRARLFALENELLQSLNEAEGSLLDDDKVIRKLEAIKKEAEGINEKVKHAVADMQEIQLTEDQYRPVAKNCSDIFFTMEQLHMVNFFYRFSLSFFLDIFEKVTKHNDNLKAEKDHDARIKIIQHDLFQEVFLRVAPGMLQYDRLPFAIQLANLCIAGTADAPSDEAVRQFMEGGVADPTANAGDFQTLVSSGVLDATAAIRASVLASKVPAFEGLANGCSGPDFAAWIKLPQPEESVPDFGQAADGGSETAVAFREMLLIQALRPDRVLDAASGFVEKVFGKGYLLEQPNRLATAIESETNARTPVMLFGTKGYDASTDVQDIANVKGMRSKLKEISVGSSSAFDQAEKAIDAASKRGTWVLLKNVHLAPKQLDQLYKKMLQRQLHDKFRLFLSTEINEKLPQGLLMNANSFTFEPAAGVKESLKRTLNSLSEEEMHQEPAERSRMYLLVAWLHAIIQERLRYTPLGWSKKYEFGEPDFRAAIYTVNQWMTDESRGKSNLPPDKIPFAALRELLSKAVYGGRVDNAIDDRLLASFVDTIFTPNAFEFGHPLVEDGADGSPGIKVPEGTKRDQFLVWANELPDKEQPFWIGLPNSAQMVLKQNLALDLLGKFLKMQTADEEDAVIDSAASNDAQATPSWMVSMRSNCAAWLEKLPEELPELEVTATSIKDPLFRFFNREVSMAVDLIKQVRSDLEDLLDVCDGTGKLTNYINALKADLIQGSVPKAWHKYTFPREVTTIVWVADFVERCKQYTRIGEHAKSGKNLRTTKVWLGGLMEPSAFFTASRQAVAQLSGISLEQLRMELSVGGPADDKALTLISLRYESCKSANGVLNSIEDMHVTEELTSLRWISEAPGYTEKEAVNLPIYLNCARTQLLMAVDFKASAEMTQGTFYEKGAAIICSALGGVA